MAVRKIRLFKIASEINIGKDAIVSFLKTKGFDIDTKPTTALTPEMIEHVYEKFRREKRAAEIQREKIQKHKDIRRSSDDVADDTVTAEKPKTEIPKVEKQPEVAEVVKDELEAKDAAEEEIKTVKEEPAKEEVAKEKEPEEVLDDGKPGVGEIIDLDKIEKPRSRRAKAKPTEKEAPVSKVEVKSVEPKGIEETTILIDKEIDKNINKEIADEKPPKTAETKIAAVKTDNTDNNEKKEIIEEKIEPSTPSEEVVSKDAASEIDDGSDEPKKKRRKSKKILEVETQASGKGKLKGLKIVGKIDLDTTRTTRKNSGDKRSKTRQDGSGAEKGRQLSGVKKKGKPPLKTNPADKKVEDRRRRKRKKSIREQISEADVEKAIRETLAGMDSATSSDRSKARLRKKAEREEKEHVLQEDREREAKTLQLTEFVTTSDLANLMNVTPNDVIIKCMELGIVVSINQRLDKDTITLIADDYGYEVDFVEQVSIQFIEDEEDAEEDLQHRPPIVTVMGHVDHGKTSLIDFIRNTSIVAGEAGGITQHIGAYNIEVGEGKAITILDTPGHEAFTAMRARGAQVTDIVILIVSADDSVMPQTVEAISHARAAEVPIVVAINKIDKVDANPDRIKQQLADHNLLVEDWGGSIQSVEISAKQGTNVDLLLEKILLEAELLELKANYNRKARGIAIEAHMNKGFGPVSTVIIQKGTLRIGDPFVVGVTSGKVRVMLDERGNKVTEAGPSTPVLVIGLDSLPNAGDNFAVVNSDTEARNISNERSQLMREQGLRQIRHITLDEISEQIQLGGVKDLHLIIKGDVGGSVEALSDSLQKLSHEEVRVAILHKGIGAITESDVILAVASKAVIIGFNVTPSAAARNLADKEKIDIRLYDIIYDCINEIQLALEGLLRPDIVEVKTAAVEIRQIFKVSKFGNIAGCYVLEGKISRNDRVKVLRDGLPIFDGEIHTLKRSKDDVKEVDQGFECGILVEGFSGIKVGDIIESYVIKEVKRTLSKKSK